MADERRRGGPPPPLAGTLWFGGWLFTIAYAQLVWWKALLALVLWPYYLGVELRPPAAPPPASAFRMEDPLHPAGDSPRIHGSHTLRA